MEEKTQCDTLYDHLLKLSVIKSEAELDNLLSTLWKTRSTGLCSSEKSNFQSLLGLPSTSQLDPVLASLRSLIRKCVHGDVTCDDLSKLFPSNLPFELQTNMVMMFQKYQNLWKQESSNERQSCPRTSVSYHVTANVAPSFTSLHQSETSSLFWPHQDDPISRFNPHNLGSSASVVSDISATCLAPMLLQNNVGPFDNLEVPPRLKSMSWQMKNCKLAPANKVAVISLKLQDYTKSPLGEMEVKFQLTKDTLEAMLSSLTYINEQLSRMVETSSGPVQKKQKQ